MITNIRPNKIDREDVPPGQSLCDYCTAKCCKYFAMPIETPTERQDFDYLRWFLLHPDVVHSAERLLEHVWDEHADPFTNTVRVTLSNLRRKLADGGSGQLIETLPGRGYRLRAHQ